MSEQAEYHIDTQLNHADPETEHGYKEKTTFCDVCGEEWEESFFCVTCSSGGHCEEQEVPNTMWDGDPNDEYVLEIVWVPNGDICLNCCNGHRN